MFFLCLDFTTGRRKNGSGSGCDLDAGASSSSSTRTSSSSSPSSSTSTPVAASGQSVGHGEGEEHCTDDAPATDVPATPSAFHAVACDCTDEFLPSAHQGGKLLCRMNVFGIDHYSLNKQVVVIGNGNGKLMESTWRYFLVHSFWCLAAWPCVR